jgi:hypothetical protein
LFDVPANGAAGIICTACELRHPFWGWDLKWIPKDKRETRRSNSIAAVTAECGNFCYGCGRKPEELATLGFALSVHHARPYAEHGDEGPQIPLCSLCHELASASQRAIRRILNRPRQ